jgi:hypothetical protein
MNAGTPAMNAEKSPRESGSSWNQVAALLLFAVLGGAAFALRVMLALT